MTKTKTTVDVFARGLMVAGVVVLLIMLLLLVTR